MGLFDSCAKIVLVVFNVLFIIIGLLLLAVGIFLRAGLTYVQRLFGLTNGLPISSISIPGISGSTAANATSATSSGLSLDQYISPLVTPFSTAFIVAGVFLCVVAFLGCCGACCTTELLIAYVVIIGIILLAQIIIIAILFTGKMDDVFKGQLNKTLVKFKGLASMELESLLWNFVQIQLKCCGINNYKDYDNAKNFQRTLTFAGGTPGVTISANRTLITPISCCKFSGNLLSSNFRPVDINCAFTPTDTTSNWKTGCWSMLMQELSQYRSPSVGAAVGVIVVQAVLFVCGTYILVSPI